MLSEHKSSECVDDPDQTILIVDPECTQAMSDYPQPPPKATPPRTGRLPGRGLNPLVRAANPLLDLAVPLRYRASYPDVEALRLQLTNAIKQFETDAKGSHVALDIIAAARYALCTLLDEMISSTPWGGNGVWACNSLLVAFHNEGSGGEKFFLILQRLAQDPDRNLDVLELMYLCLALGLEGRYGVIEGGQAQLASLRERLQKLIKSRRGNFEHDLSPHWEGGNGKHTALIRQFPIWGMAALAAVSLLALQLWFSFDLNRLSAPVSARMQRMQVNLPTVPPEAVATVAVKPAARVAALLAPDIERGLVSVNETAERATITLQGDGVFATGSAHVEQNVESLLDRIGDAVKLVPGKVIVIGHTDNVGVRKSSRFSSNWALSKARADSVRKLLATRGIPDHSADRFLIEGLGATEPLAPNDSPANRARNRRVEIIVLTPAGTS